MILFRDSNTAVVKRLVGIRPVRSSPYFLNNASVSRGVSLTPSRLNTSANSCLVASPGTPPWSMDTRSNACVRRSRSVWLNDANAMSFFFSRDSFSAMIVLMSFLRFSPAAGSVMEELPGLGFAFLSTTWSFL